MGLAWQQGPLATGTIGMFLVPKPLPERLLYAEPLRRRMRVMLGGRPIAESDDVIVLHEPARYPVAYFPKSSIRQDALVVTDRRSDHPDLDETTWFEVKGGDKRAPRGAWEHTALEPFASMRENRVAFAWAAMDGFYEEVQRTTFCPYKGICSYYDVGDAHQAAWAYLQPYREVDRIAAYVSFEPDKLEVTIDGQRLEPEPGQHVVAHGPDRNLTTNEVAAQADGRT